MSEKLGTLLRLMFLIACAVTMAAPLYAQKAPLTAADRPRQGHAYMEDLECLSAVHEFSVVLADANATEAQKQRARMMND